MTTRNYSTFTALMQCEHCGGGLPLQGPMRTVQCSACQGNNDVSIEEIVDFLHFAAEGENPAVLGEIKWKFFWDGQPCPGCGSPIDMTPIPVGVESSTPCAKCGATILSFPPPPWLKEQLPGLVQIYGAERDPADIPASGTPLAVAEEKTKTKPILTACPQCSGSLTVTADSPRTMACTFCGASVFLPEELWRTLHPVKRVAPWSIAYDGDLDRLEDIRQKEKEKEKEKADTAREQQEREAELRERESKEQKAIRKNRRNMSVGALIGSLLVVAILLLFYYFIFTS